MKRLLHPVWLLLLLITSSRGAPPAELKDLSINGGVQDGKARLVIEAQLQGLSSEREKLLFATSLQHSIQVTREKLSNTITATLDIIQGEPTELTFNLTGVGEIRQVTGEALQDWSVRQESNGVRRLILRPRKSVPVLKQLVVIISADSDLRPRVETIQPLTLTPLEPALFNGYVKVEAVSELDVQPANPSGLVPIEPKFLPDGLRVIENPDEPQPLAFRFHGSAYVLPLRIALADPESRRVILRDFKLAGQLSDQSATFTLSATARVKNPSGASLTLLSGNVALIAVDAPPEARVKFEQGRFVLVLDRAGDFPIVLKFKAAVRPEGGWNQVDFRVAPSALQPLMLQGLAPDTQFQFTGAARPDRVGDAFTTFLPPDGAVKFSWKESRPEVEGKLFYSAEMLSQIVVSPGLMRQVALLDFKVMQGELNRVVLLLRGEGSVTRVQGANVLAWQLEPPSAANQTERRLVVQFNQPQKDQFSLQIQIQTELGVFPQAVNAVQLRPEDATRFAGHLRVVNEGAVRLEVVQATGLSQISPEQFPETDLTKAQFASGASQRFAFRFSGSDYALRIQADNVLPELSVSEVLTYHLGETELAVEAELEIDIREAPVRELTIRVPKGYAIARLNASGLTDYFLTENPNEPDAELRLVYGQPLSGRQVVQLRLERNAALGEAAWTLPRIEVPKAKSTRGHIAASADAGFRLTPERTQALTEIATAFFPKKVPGIQVAFRLSEPSWQATLRVERLPQSIQADVFHLFSIGEGIGYGSSTINYVISGAPISTFNVELSAEYFNVEFTGKDIRNWQKSASGYTVQLHTPVSGSYTLLATYERPFKAQGDTLTFTGARPLDAQSEQGHTIIISAYQFQVEPVNVSPGLLALETAEVPAEYRLFFDAPILKAYRYTARPFNLQLSLSPLRQGETLSLVVDRAALTTRISKDGEILTDARYFVKNRGNPHFAIRPPAGTELWSATVNGVTVVPVKDGETNLIPLPQRADPNAVQVVDLKLAARSKNPERVTAAAPVVTAPLLLAEWTIQPDTGQRLVYRGGSLAPAGGVADLSGFAAVADLFRGPSGGAAVVQFLAGLAFIVVAIGAWRAALRPGNYRYSFRHMAGAVVGLVAFTGALLTFVFLADLAQHEHRAAAANLVFLAPVQQSGSAISVEVANLEDKLGVWTAGWKAWPALIALIVWVYAAVKGQQWFRPVLLILGWTLLLWAALRYPNGGAMAFAVLIAFLIVHVLWPALRRLWQLPRRPVPPLTDNPAAATALAALLVLGFGWLLLCPGEMAAADIPVPVTNAWPALRKEAPLAESVTLDVRVEDQFALATAKIHWPAVKNQTLPILYEPAVLTKINYPSNALKLVQGTIGSRRTYQLLAQQSGTFDIEITFQLQVTKKEGESGFAVPTQFGLVNHLTLTLKDLDVDVVAPQSVSIERSSAGCNTVARLVLAPVNDSWVGWRPRSRDVKGEKAVFYAELIQLYAPSVGVIEGAHQVQIRPAQGELSELIFDVPKGTTVIDVFDGEARTNQTPASGGGLISLWRFAPDTQKLRVTLSPPQSRPFTLFIRSQVATGPLPYEQAVGLISVTNAAGQFGLFGVATSPEVQLDNVTTTTLSPINLEDFPAGLLTSLGGQLPGLTLRRAFRYADAKATAVLKASAVAPDVRVETQETLSLGEDRTVLAATIKAAITRAGIFRLSFVLPAGLEVESISGQALSHWTELTTEAGRVVTLHLKGKTEGEQEFALSLVGPGIKPVKAWPVPRLLVREASKQRGQLLIVPEQGMRLQVSTREGVTQLDPQRSGIRQKGVLAFRLLQDQWSLTLDLEQVDPWVQVSSLQHVNLTEAQLKVTANLQYQIENTGLKSLRVRVPTNAESVRFRGEQVSDFLATPGQVQDGMQTWEIKLHRRVIGKYLLQLSYQTSLPEKATNIVVHGVQALDVSLQRGFLTLESEGRLQVRIGVVPPALQPTEWQSVPRVLRQDLESASANYAFRLVEPVFQLPVQLERHEAAKLLEARVQSITLTSVISDEGVMLTEVRLEMLPGDKRLLHFTLPSNAEFWFAFVNQNGVWPWRKQDDILIPLEQQSRAGKALTVELFYSSKIGSPGTRSLDLNLVGPKFDLPLENITWHVYLNDKWKLKDWSGTLQLQEDTTVAAPAAINLQTYLQNEASLNQEKTRAAEEMLSMGNDWLERGDPQQARRAFQAAYGLSTHDNAFNEDARVQLHNLKLQQALVGLNVRQAANAGGAEAAAGKPIDVRARKEVTYTQQEAKQIIDGNTAEENAALMRLAERLIQQQDAAVSSPNAIRASIPQQGRLLTFRRAVQVDKRANLELNLEAKATRPASRALRLLILTGAFVLLAALGWATQVLRRRSFATATAPAV